MVHRRLLATVMFLMLVLPLFSSDAPDIRLVILGQDDPVYVWFGHSALMVDDSLNGDALVYDYGVFDFEQEQFFLNFAQGRLIYSKLASSARRQVYAAQMQQRDMRVITLNLPQEKRIKMAFFLNEEVQPGRNTYLYHHYEDNCATRIRDIIDDALGGAFYQWSSAQEGRMSYRGHFSRHAGNSYPMLWLLNFLQGPEIDKPITRWDEMFLPLELEQAVLEFPGLAGETVTVLEFPETRSLIPETYTSPWPWFLLTGILVSGLLLFSRRYLRTYGIIQAVLGLLFGLLGTGLLVMMWFTDHEVTRGNLNALMVNPLWFALIPWGIAVARGKIYAMKHIVLFWRILSLAGAAVLIIRLFMEYPQGNQLTLALLLPILFVQAQWHRLRIPKRVKLT